MYGHKQHQCCIYNRVSYRHYYTLLGGCYVYSSTINQLPTQGENIHGG